MHGPEFLGCKKVATRHWPKTNLSTPFCLPERCGGNDQPSCSEACCPVGFVPGTADGVLVVSFPDRLWQIFVSY